MPHVPDAFRNLSERGMNDLHLNDSSDKRSAQHSFSKQPSSSVAFADSSDGGFDVEEEVYRYAQWISSKVDLAGGLDQKMSALSRRTAAEFQKATHERSEFSRRLTSLEDFVNGGFRKEKADASQIEDNFRQEVGRLSEMIADLASQMQTKHGQCTQALEGLARHMDGGAEEIRRWRLDEEARLNAAHRDLELLNCWRDEVTDWKTGVGNLIARMVTVENNAESLCNWREEIENSRATVGTFAAAHDGEMNNNTLTDIRLGFLRQRANDETCKEHLGGGSFIAKRDLELRDTWLENQLADLSAALSRKLERQVASLKIELRGIVPIPEKDVHIFEQMQELRSRVTAEVDKSIAFARDETRIVHNEIMSLDTRVATLEGQGSPTRGCSLVNPLDQRS